MNELLVLAIIMGSLLILSVPIAVSIGIATLTAIVLSDLPYTFFSQRLFNLFDSFPLMAVPFFILAGEILQRGTLANSLLGMCRTLVGHLRGGLALISIFTCLFYGALCGSGAATVAAVGGMMIPQMVKEGYPRAFSTALNTASGSLGIMIPPSIPLILIGAFGGISITNLFIASVIPGFILALLFVFVAMIIITKNDYGFINPKASSKERMKAVWEAKWSLGVPLIVLGGIYGGIFTPTEGGIIAVFYALMVEIFITKQLTFKIFTACLESTLLTMGSIFFVMITAFAMGAFLQFNSVETALITWMHSVTTNLNWWLALVMLIIVVAGMFIDATALILVLSPLLVPIAIQYGMDPTHFGIVILLCVSIGFITPPIAIMLYIGCTVGQISVVEVSKAIFPFIIAMIIALLIVAYFPFFTTVLI